MLILISGWLVVRIKLLQCLVYVLGLLTKSCPYDSAFTRMLSYPFPKGFKETVQHFGENALLGY